MAAGVYLYCLGRSSDLSDKQLATLDVRTVDGSGAPFRAVTSGDLAALVSDTDIWQFEIERDLLMGHHRVLEQAMTLGDILPVAFGTVAESDDDIISGLLEPRAEQLRANLDFIHERVELALRVMWDQERLFEEIVEESAEIRSLRDAIAGVPEEQSYAERIQLGELTSAAIDYKWNEEREQILHVLEPLCVDLVVTENTGDLLILNASFLVDRERESEFDDAVQEIAGPREGRMLFRYLGPLPPAHFVSVFIDAGDEQ